MYLTYDEYLTMGGDLDVAAFNNAEWQAEAQIDELTMRRLRKSIITERVKRTVFALIVLNQKIEQEQVASYSNDGVSISVSTHTREENARRVAALINTSLAGEVDITGTPLLYCGVVL